MPARRKKLLSRQKKRNKVLPIVLVCALVFIVLLILKVFVFRTKFWSNDSKLILAINREDSSVLITSFDPRLQEIANIYIPKNTEVEVSRQLGIWKLGSVWQLGANEKIDGKLLTGTLRHYFKFPVVAWADSGAEGFSEGSLGKVAKALFNPYKTNLTFGDKVSLAAFSLRVNNTKRTGIDLAETTYLIRTNLKDGSEGYRVTRSFSQRLLSIFTDDIISQNSYKISIIDASGEANAADDVGELMQVLGAKVASVTNDKEEGNINCFIRGNDKVVVDRVADLLSCDDWEFGNSGSFDLEIKLGNSFIKSF